MTQLEMLSRQSSISKMFPQDRHAPQLRQQELLLEPQATAALITPLWAGTLSPPSVLLAHGCNDQPSLGWPAYAYAYAYAYASAPRFATCSHRLLPRRQVMEESRAPPTSK